MKQEVAGHEEKIDLESGTSKKFPSIWTDVERGNSEPQSQHPPPHNLPGPEWVFPSSHDASEIDFRDLALNRLADIVDINNEASQSSDVIIDPSQTYVVEVVDGVVVSSKRCVVKFCGSTICDDSYTFLICPKILFLCLIIIVGIEGIFLLTIKKS